MRLTIVGCSGSFPGPGNPSSCYLVEAEEYRVLLDVGSGSVGALQRYADLADLDAILVSHLHPDHCIDLLALYVARSYDPRRRFGKLPVHLPTDGGDHLARAYGRADGPGLTGAFDFHHWTAGEQQVGPIRVSVARVAHPVEAYGIRLEHDGKVLTYSGDTGPCDAVVDLARDADLALFESSFEVGRDDSAPAGIHMTGREAGEAAAAAGARRLVLTHLPPWNDPDVALRDARSAYAGDVQLARPGATYDV